MSDLIPVLDWEWMASDRHRSRFMRQFREHMLEVGFVRVRGAPVSQTLIAELYEAAREFFLLPEAVRCKYFFPEFSGQRGYTPLGFESYNGAEPELKEWFGCGRLTGTHTMFSDPLPPPEDYFPSEVPAFQDLLLDLHDQLDAFAIEEMKILFEALEVDPKKIDTLFAKTDTQQRLVYYRDPSTIELTGTYRAGPHCDTGFLTNIPAPTKRGLRLQTPSGAMVFAEFGQNEIVTNTGKGFALFTGGLFTPRLHDVVVDGRASGDRMSAPCFTHPHPSAIVRVPEELLGRIAGPVPAPFRWGAFLRQDLSRHGVHKED